MDNGTSFALVGLRMTERAGIDPSPQPRIRSGGGPGGTLTQGSHEPSREAEFAALVPATSGAFLFKMGPQHAEATHRQLTLFAIQDCGPERRLVIALDLVARIGPRTH